MKVDRIFMTTLLKVEPGSLFVFESDLEKVCIRFASTVVNDHILFARYEKGERAWKLMMSGNGSVGRGDESLFEPSDEKVYSLGKATFHCQADSPLGLVKLARRFTNDALTLPEPIAYYYDNKCFIRVRYRDYFAFASLQDGVIRKTENAVIPYIKLSLETALSKPEMIYIENVELFYERKNDVMGERGSIVDIF